MTRFRAALLCPSILCLAFLAACGPLPRPFQAERDAGSDLLVLRDRAGIVVAPPAGPLPADPGKLAEAMAARLRDLNVPAGTGALNGESRYLQARATRVGGTGLTLHWELWDLNGRLIGAYAQHRMGDSESESAGLIAALAAEAAPRIAALIQTPPVAEARIPGFPGARLAVPPLAAEAGTAASGLVPALRAALAAAGLPVTARPGPEDILVLGDIALEPAREGVREVAIVWSVVRARDRHELGQVAQRNTVPAGRLEGSWGPLARIVARNAAAGVIDLLERRALR